MERGLRARRADAQRRARDEGGRGRPRCTRAGGDAAHLVTRRRALLFGVFVIVSLALLYVVLPQLAGWHTLARMNEGDVWWIAIAIVLELLSIASYIAIFQGRPRAARSPINWRESYLIMMAGLAATRLFAAGGAGGVAVTVWALRRSGMERREVAQRMIAFLVLLYGVYMGSR